MFPTLTKVRNGQIEKCEELAYMLSALPPIATEERTFQIGSSVRIPEVKSEGSANQLTRP